MKFTIFELSLIHLVLGAIRNAPMSEIEKILDLRKKFKPTDKEFEIDKKGNEEVHKTLREIKVSEDELAYILDKIGNPELGLPVLEETIKLNNKLKPKED